MIIQTMKTNTMKRLLQMVLITAFLRKVQSEKCQTYRHRVFCSELTLKPGEHLEINNDGHTITEIYIYNASIASIPSGFFNDFKNAEMISLRHVGASIIDPEAFQGMSHLKELGLSGNGITEIQADIFTDLTSLEELDLPFNKLTEIKPRNFDSLKELKDLDLSFNDIKEIQPGSFNSLTHLKYLNLTFNEIKEIQSGIFKSLINLIELNLSHNNLNKIFKDSFEGLSNLEYLHLRGCFITQLDVGCFKDFSKLIYLDLGYNLVKKIEAGIFSNLHNLEIVKLNHNYLNGIPENDFYSLTKLKSLSINDNEISSLDAVNLLVHLTNLADVKLNNNTWQCAALHNIIEAFQFHGVEILDSYTENHANVYGISCEDNQAKIDTVIVSTESSQYHPRTDSYTTDKNFDTTVNIQQRLENLEKEYKNCSNRVTVKNAIIIGVSIFAVILLFVFVLFYVYYHKKISSEKTFAVKYNDVALISDFQDS